MPRHPAPLGAVLLLLAAAAAAQRDLDPVVAVGADVPDLLGKPVARIVAFRYRSVWQQIPVQVDERAIVSFAQIRQLPTLQHAELVYTDPNTFTGADPDPSFDADDELCFMARDAGDPAPPGDPPGVVAGSRLGVAVVDPLGRPLRYAYLFESDGSLSPAAGRDDVDYRFVLLSGNYKQTYNLGNRFNPESSTATTSHYRLHFSDRWILDETTITASGASGVDVLDRHKFQFAPGICQRTTETFSRGGGAMIANIDGPLRGIRSVVGANSGVITQRDWIMYEGRTITRTHTRVHPIGATWDFYDFGPAATGMLYHDDLNPAGVVVDGSPDPINQGALQWQLVSGPQGSLTIAFALDTDIPSLLLSSFYFDDLAPTWSQCTGDPWAYAASGPATGPLPNTDPLLGPAYRLVSDRSVYYEGPGTTVARAALLARDARNPLVARAVAPYRLFGRGCAGTGGAPTLDATGSPTLGGNVTLEVYGLPQRQPGVIFFGASNQQWGGQPLPIDLTSIGMTGCLLSVSTEVPVGVQSQNGIARLPISIPVDPSLVGVSTFQQHAGLDPGANPLGVVTSNAGELTVLP